MPSLTKLLTAFSTCATGTRPWKGQPKEVEMAPERVMPFRAANSAQSAKPSIIATGLRECVLSGDDEYDAAHMEKLFLSLA